MVIEIRETATEIRRLRPEDAALYREIRLEALQRNPEAFSRTFEVEAAQTQAGAGYIRERSYPGYSYYSSPGYSYPGYGYPTYAYPSVTLRTWKPVCAG